MLEASMRDYLIADAGVSQQCVGRISAIDRFQNSVVPAITYQRISGVRNDNLDGPSGLVRARIQINCWAKLYEQCKDLARAVRIAMNSFNGSQYGTTGIATTLLNDMDDDDPQAKLKRVIMDFEIFYNEEIS